MKYMIKEKLMALLLVFALVVTCVPAVFVSEIEVYAASKTVKLSKSKATVKVGKTVTLELKNAKAKSVKWKSSKSKIATVKSGKVTAKSPGKVTITATYKKKSYKCVVTVTAPAGKLSKNAISIRKGKTTSLSLKSGYGKTKWKTSNKKVATVNSKGVVTGKGAGTATITATNSGRNYTCKVSVLTAKKLGSASVKADKNQVAIGGVEVGFMPGMIGKKDKKAKVTVSEISGAPKFQGISMKTYDFELSGAKFGTQDVAKLEIPLDISSDEQPVAAYYNEKTATYEPVASLYRDGKVMIITDHFSAYSIGKTVKGGGKAAIASENTTQAYIMYYYSLPDPKLSTDESLSVMQDALKSKEPTESCLKIAKDAIKDMIGWDYITNVYGTTMDFGVNFANSTGCTCGLTDFVNKNDKAFGYLGFAITMLDALSDAIDGNGKMALYKGAQANLGLISSAMIGWLNAGIYGTAAAGALAFVVAVPLTMLSTVYNDALSNNEKKWFDVYNSYYKTTGKRHLYQWRNIFQKYFDNKDLTTQEIADKIQKEIDDYADFFWNDRTLVAEYYSESQQKAWGLEGGLTADLEKKISDAKRKELYDGDIKTVVEWFYAKQQKDATEMALKAADQLAKDFDHVVTIRFYDESAGGAASSLAGYTVRWKEVPGNITDPQNMQVKLNSKGEGKIKFNTWAYFEYGFKPNIELVSPDGTVVDEQKIQWKLTDNNINLMTADVIDYVASHSLIIDPTELEVDQGSTADIEVRNVSLSTIKASSSDNSIAKVTIPSSGNTLTVTGMKKGTATITVKSGAMKATCKVTVNEFENTKTKRTLYEGQTVESNIDALLDTDKYANLYDTTEYEVSSSDESVVKISGDYKWLEGIKAGKATVKMTLKGLNYEDRIWKNLSGATISVTVKKKKENVSISASKATIDVGKTKTLYLKNDDGKIQKGVTWKSSNTSVATVSGGKVKGVKAGNATITATYKKKTYKCKITVKKKESTGGGSTTKPSKEQFVGSYDVKIGKSITINAQSGMDASKIKWSSSNTNIVTVNSKGKVTGRGQGVAYVYADYGDTRYKFEIWSGDYLD